MRERYPPCAKALKRPSSDTVQPRLPLTVGAELGLQDGHHGAQGWRSANQQFLDHGRHAAGLAQQARGLANKRSVATHAGPRRAPSFPALPPYEPALTDPHPDLSSAGRTLHVVRSATANTGRLGDVCSPLPGEIQGELDDDAAEGARVGGPLKGLITPELEPQLQGAQANRPPTALSNDGSDHLAREGSGELVHHRRELVQPTIPVAGRAERSGHRDLGSAGSAAGHPVLPMGGGGWSSPGTGRGGRSAARPPRTRGLGEGRSAITSSDSCSHSKASIKSIQRSRRWGGHCRARQALAGDHGMPCARSRSQRTEGVGRRPRWMSRSTSFERSTGRLPGG